MSSNTITKTLYINNMTCVNCENIIERKLLETAGIISITASYSKGTAVVSYDADVISLEKIIQVLEAEHYYAREENESDSNTQNIGIQNTGIKDTGNYKDKAKQYHEAAKRRDYSDIASIAIIIFALFLIARRFGLLNVFNSFPVAKDGMGYGMLFLIGILTSVHCVAMCGGICLSQCVPKNDGAFTNRFAAMRPSLLYNLGRVISYTIIGGIVGAIGSVISFSGTAKGIVQILAGVFMVIMGLNMLNVFPWLRRFNPRMPKIFAKKIYAQRNSKSPLYIGILNGLMPCGPLQAMQLYALSTGSPIKGALSMFLFSIGTVPLLFAFGALSSFLNKKFTTKMMTVSAILVVFLGIFMFNNGIGLSGIVLPGNAAIASTSQKENVAIIDGDVQTVTSGIGSGSYEPIIVQKGIPVKWTIIAEDGEINGCNNSIIIQKYKKQLNLTVGDNMIEFTPTESGTVPFSCWMGMIRSNITVVDDLKNVDSNVIADVEAATNSGGLSDYNNLLDIQIPTDKIAVATVKEDGTQSVEISYDKAGFSPAVIVLQSGLETVWNIKAEGVNSSQSTLIFPNYNAMLEIVEGKNPIEFIPTQDFDFFTSDNSYYGYVKVVEDLSNIDLDAIKQEISEYQPSDYSGLGSGAGASCH